MGVASDQEDRREDFWVSDLEDRWQLLFWFWISDRRDREGFVVSDRGDRGGFCRRLGHGRELL